MMTKTKTSAQQGNVMMAVLIFIFVLSALWIIALSMTGSELSFVGGRKVDSQQFYDAEAGVASVIDNFSANIPTTPTSAPVSNVTITNGGKTVAQVAVRPIRNDATYATTYNLPLQDFEFDPPAGSGSGVNTSVARRYVITSEVGGKVVQVGVYRVVPK